jgi:hypothetical protein
MGYTHYWRRKQEFPKRAFLRAVEDCRKVCQATGVPLAGWDGTGAPAFQAEEICFNGQSATGYETFAVPRKCVPTRPPDEGGLYFDFCKTANMPYDLAVQCCLLVLQHHFGKQIVISSDGNEADWQRAVETCQRVLGYGQFAE